MEEPVRRLLKYKLKNTWIRTMATELKETRSTIMTEGELVQDEDGTQRVHSRPRQRGGSGGREGAREKGPG